MEHDELLGRVRALRARGCTPTEIARALGLRKSEAARLVRVAAGGQTRRGEAGGGDADVDGTENGAGIRCWVSPGWRNGLTVDGHREWPSGGLARTEAAQSGIAAVLLATTVSRGRASVCGYLVDTWCLGVKNALGPRRMRELEVDAFRQAYFAVWQSGGIPAPLSLAQHLVLGAVEYAHGLGLAPHRDFRRARAALEPWQGPSAITFGKDRMPYYISGPHDEPRHVVETLERTIGRGGYHFIVPDEEFLDSNVGVGVAGRL